MSIKTNTVTDYGITTGFRLDWVETVNIPANTSTLTFRLFAEQNPTGSGYQRTLTSGSVMINGESFSLPSNIKVYDGYKVWEKAVNIKHDEDGSKSINASISVLVGGASRLTGSGTITLTNIPRGSTMELSSHNMADGGDDLVITISPYVGSYNHTIKLWLEGETKATYQLNAGVNILTIANSVLSGFLGENYSGVATYLLELETFSNGLKIGESYFSDTLFRKGFITLSLYQGADGTGFAAGHEATGPGVDLTYNDIDLSNSNITGLNDFEEIVGTNLYGRKWSNGFLEYWLQGSHTANLTSWANHWYEVVDIGISFPVPFTAKPHAMGNLDYNTFTTFVIYNQTVNSAGSYRVFSPNNQTGASFNWGAYYWGRWK